MRAKFRKNWLDINTVSEKSSCVDLVPYDPEILDPHNFRINSPTIKELRKMVQNQYLSRSGNKTSSTATKRTLELDDKLSHSSICYNPLEFNSGVLKKMLLSLLHAYVKELGMGNSVT